MIGLVDCETTDLFPETAGLIEFTCAVIDPKNMVECDRFKSGQISVKPGTFSVDPAALLCNGYKVEALHLGAGYIEVARSFEAFVKRYGPLTFVSYNGFDWDFIERLFARAGIPRKPLFSHRRIDIQSFIVARNTMLGLPDASSSLAAVSKEFGITAPDHTSDADVTAAAEVMRQMFGQIDWDSLKPKSLDTAALLTSALGPADSAKKKGGK